jgi:hypothetical protein
MLQAIQECLIGVIIVAMISMAGIFVLDKVLCSLKQPCTAYQAIDGKPVCIEYKLNK